MNNLEGAICYLAGPIDFDKSLGKSFRVDLIQKLKDANLNLVILDPTNKLSNLVRDIDVEQDYIKKCKERKDYEAIRSLMKKIVTVDLRQVDYSDFIIVYVNTKIHMCGSYHEALVGLYEKKPVLFVIEGGIDNAPSWLFGIGKLEWMFNNFDELTNYLTEINTSDNLPINWILIRKQVFDLQKELFH